MVTMTTPIDPTVDYNKYIDFVDSTTSFPSKDAEEFVARIYDCLLYTSPSSNI